MFGSKPMMFLWQSYIVGNSVFGCWPSLVTPIWEDLHINLESFQAEGRQGNSVLEAFSPFIVLFLFFPSFQKIPLEKLLFESALYLNITWMKACLYLHIG